MEQKLILIILLISPFLAYSAKHEKGLIFDIRKYGARPNSDISQALTKAWKEAIASSKASKIYIPRGIWMLSQVKLYGPNRAPILLQVDGTVKAYPDLQKLPEKRGDWIAFGYIDRFTLAGGVFDGSGQAAWKSNNCKKNPHCIKLPINLSFNFMEHSVIRDATTKDSKNFHVKCFGCHNVTFRRLTVTAPGDSPNTDGIHLSHSSHVSIVGGTIATGDDCISMSSDVSQVRIRGVTCGPGHGISVGSLGGAAAEKDVSGIYVTNCTFVRTENGVRVKTWPSGPAALVVSDLRFEDLIMVGVNNPVVIDQQYCPNNLCDHTRPSSIKVRKVSIKNIRGTTATAEAMTFNCSKSRPCEDVEIGNVDLKYVGKFGHITTKCANVRHRLVGKQNPTVCASLQWPSSSTRMHQPHHHQHNHHQHSS